MNDVQAKIQELETDTFSMSFRHIEGFLCKEIQNSSAVRRTKRHLKYFRIIFSMDKLNIKNEKYDKEMRSLALKDLLRVTVIRELTQADARELEEDTG